MFEFALPFIRPCPVPLLPFRCPRRSVLKDSQLFLHIFISSLPEGNVFRLLTLLMFFQKTCAIQILELLMWRLLLTPPQQIEDSGASFLWLRKTSDVYSQLRIFTQLGLS